MASHRYLIPVAVLAWTAASPVRADLLSVDGLYVGAGLIANFGDVSYHFMDTDERGSLDPDGVGLAVLGGYLWRRGPWVYGIEGTYHALDSSDSMVTASGVTFRQENNWVWSVRGRLGREFDDNHRSMVGAAQQALTAGVFGR